MLCKVFSVLPNPGGLMQQNPRHIKRMEKVLEAHEAHLEQDRKDLESKNRLKGK